MVNFAFSVWGTLAGHTYLWIPYSGLVGSIVVLLANVLAEQNEERYQWMAANDVLKSVFSGIGMYLLFTQIACAVLGFYWIVEN